MDVFQVSPSIRLIDLDPFVGYRRFIGGYLVCGEEKKAVIETGPTAAVPNLLAALDDLGVARDEIDYLLLTHIHIDHGGGVGAAARAMPNARVVVHERGRRHLVDPTRLWQASIDTLGDLARRYGEIEAVPGERIIDAGDGMEIDLGGVVLETLLTPGHAPHHLSVYCRPDDVLVAGEAAGCLCDGRPRPATPPPFRMEVSLASLDRLIALAPDKICFGHFGCHDDAVTRMKTARQQLVTWYETINAAAAAGKEPVEILARLREEDSALDFLDGLDEATFEREHSLLFNTIRGMTTTGS